MSSIFLSTIQVIGNRSFVFLEQRQKDLEIYLQKVLFFLQHRMCREFIEFLDMNKYDIIYLLQDLANTFFTQSELLLQFYNKRYEFSALELYAISERLKIPCPENDGIDKIYDFTHVIDFCSQIERLTIRPRNVSDFFQQNLLIAKYSNALSSYINRNEYRTRHHFLLTTKMRWAPATSFQTT